MVGSSTGRGRTWLLFLVLAVGVVVVGRQWSQLTKEEAPSRGSAQQQQSREGTDRKKRIARTKFEGGVDMKPDEANRVMTIEGRVVDETGAGINGATVRVLPGDGPIGHDLQLDRRLILGERSSTSDALDQLVAEAKPIFTDSEGTFRIEDAPEHGVVVASAPGFNVGLFERPMEPFPQEVSIALSSAQPAITGVIRDRVSGAPALGMRVVAVPAEMALFPAFEPGNSPSVGVDAEGRFEFVGLAPGSYRVFALSNGSAYRSSTSDESVAVRWSGESAETIELSALLGGVLSVGVFNEQRGVAGAHCSLSELGPSGEPHYRGLRGRPTDRDGLCRFEGLSFGRTHIARVEARGHVAQQIEVPELKAASPRQELRVVLEAGYTVSGTVRYKDGVPAAGAQIALLPKPESEGATTPSSRYWPSRVAEDGRFEFSEVPRGQADLVVGFTSFSPGANFTPHGGRKIPVQVRPNAGDLDIEIDGVALHGVVVDADGRPVETARVALRASSPSAMMFPLPPSRLGAARVSSDGQFTLHALETPKGAWVEATADGYARSKPVLVRQTDAELRIELQRSARVRGRVVAEAEPRGTLSGHVFLDDDSDRALEERAQRSVPLGRNGEFALEVPPGKVVLAARVEGYLAPEPMQLVVKPGEEADVTLRVVLGAAIEGTVVNAAGEALAGAQVKIRLEGPLDSSTFIPDVASDAQGRFRLANVPPGQHTLSASHRNQSSGVEAQIRVEAETTSKPVVLRFSATGRVSGTVTQGYEPAVGVMVTLAVDGAGQLGGQAMTDDQGRFELSTVAEGNYQAFAIDVAKVRAQLPGLMFSTNELPDNARPVEVRAGQHAVVALELPTQQGVRLSGTVKGLSPGMGLMMGMVILFPVGESLESGAQPVGLPATLAPTGTFQMLEVPSGTFTLAIYSMVQGASGGPPKPIHEQTVVVGTEDVDLTVEIPDH